MQEKLLSIRRRRLYEDIVQQFYRLIRQGALQHGDRLPSERELAEQFNVSRSSVREAIRSLERQGLVVSRRGSGNFINTESLDSVVALLTLDLDSDAQRVREVFEMRHMLEPQIVALAAQRITAEEVARLRGILEEQQRQIAAGETGVDADTAFHFALAQATHNAALIKTVNAVEDILRQSRYERLQQTGRPQRSLASHTEILDKVAAGDIEGARQAMEHHLTTIEPSSALAEFPQDKPTSEGAALTDPTWSDPSVPIVVNGIGRV